MIFITREVRPDGKTYAGPKITADSWAEAQIRAENLGAAVEGVLKETYNIPDNPVIPPTEFTARD